MHVYYIYGFLGGEGAYYMILIWLVQHNQTQPYYFMVAVCIILTFDFISSFQGAIFKRLLYERRLHNVIFCSRSPSWGSCWKNIFFLVNSCIFGSWMAIVHYIGYFSVINCPKITLDIKRYTIVRYIMPVQQILIFTTSIFSPKLQNKLTQYIQFSGTNV